MNTPIHRDQRGVAMLLELILVAAVLVLVGLALYQSNHRTTDTAALVNQPATATTDKAAEAAVKALEQDAAAEAALSAADSSAEEVSAMESDMANLEGSFNENSF